MMSFFGKIYGLTFVLLIALTLMGCGAGNSRQDIPPVAPAQEQAVPTTPPTPTPTLPTEINSPVSPVSPIKESAPMPASKPSNEPIKGSEPALAAAIADLSQRQKIPAGDISLVSMEAKEWSDASLGCPQEGMMYAQVITPGYLMVLAAQGQQYPYHTDAKTNVVLCQK
jgi:hypothetical protein